MLPTVKPPMYVKIKTNKPVGNVRMLEPDHSNLTPCDCDPFSHQPCDSDSNCLNRILLVECSPTVCKAGDKCRNQRFEKREYPPLIPYKTDGRGWGLKTLADIPKGDFIIEYVGEVIDESEYKHRIDNKHNEKDQNFYFLTIDKDRMIDAGPKGNFARFMNHSCQPNCETQKWTVNGDTRVGLFAIDDIPANSELTFNYNLQCVGPDKKPCMCGAPNCSGYIGSKATKLVEEDKKKLRADLTKSGKKWKNRRGGGLSAWKMGVEECFLCGKSGDLIDCCNKTCPKSYHLECVDLKKPPKERWICPWHCCDVCEKRTSQRCSICTSAFCLAHSDGNLHFDSNQLLVCNKHSKAPAFLARVAGEYYRDILWGPHCRRLATSSCICN
uniref:Histone-lysine N-methyltransferase n=1 Tax=Timema monikensis TaxID=170555 RepID=A0A7R9EGA9_9NEOP|nr:unnamed protein product [Timema monikensis]